MQFQKQKRDISKKRKWLIGLILVLILLFGFYCWYTSRYSYLPDWYLEEAPISQPRSAGVDSVPPAMVPGAEKPPPPHQSARPLTLPDINYELRRNGIVRLPEAVIVALIRTTAQQVLPASGPGYLKAVRCQIRPSGAILEVIVDVANIPWDRIPRQYHYTRPFIEQLPERGKTEIYFKLFGAPVIEDNYLTHSENATLTVGKVEYRLEDLFRLPFIFERFNGRIDLDRLPFNKIYLEKGTVVLVQKKEAP